MRRPRRSPDSLRGLRESRGVRRRATGRGRPGRCCRRAAASSVAKTCTPWPSSGSVVDDTDRPCAVARTRPPTWRALPHTRHHQRPGSEDARRSRAGAWSSVTNYLAVGVIRIGRRRASAVRGSGSGSGSGSPACSCVCAIASSSCWGSSPGSSNGSRLRRCGSASSAATRMSSSSTVSSSAPRRVRDSGARHHQVGAHPVDVECRAQRGDAA